MQRRMRRLPINKLEFRSSDANATQKRNRKEHGIERFQELE